MEDDIFTVEVLVRMGDIQGVHVDSHLFTVNLGVTNGEVSKLSSTYMDIAFPHLR